MKAFAQTATLGAVTLMLAPAAAAERRSEEFRWQGRLTAGQAVEIKGVNGDVEAVAAAGAELEIQAVKSGRRSDPSEVKIEVLPHDTGVTVCAVYPAPPGRATECATGGGARMGTRDNDVQVRFTVRVPKGVRFIGRTVNGDVQAGGLDADVEVHTVNGSIRIDTLGHASAESVNGSIRASLGRTELSQLASFETVNGGITLELPAALSASVHAETVNGSIETDFPLAIQRKVSRRRLSGTIGGGGGPLELKTVNGSIRLRRTASRLP